MSIKTRGRGERIYYASYGASSGEQKVQLPNLANIAFFSMLLMNAMEQCIFRHGRCFIEEHKGGKMFSPTSDSISHAFT